MLVAATAVAGAQMPGAPVLQNAWASPGIVGAVNFAGGSDGSIYAAAASWASSSARFQLSGGIGIRSRTGSGSGRNSVYGIRLAVPFGGTTADFGFGAFVGVGAGASVSASPADSLASTTVVPVGLAIGWRHSLGGVRGFSIYATPSYNFFTGGSNSAGLVRTAVGVDLGFTKFIGLTAGADFGQSRPRVEGGPSGTRYGVGVSYALGHR
jgi:hypothetical protein